MNYYQQFHEIPLFGRTIMELPTFCDTILRNTVLVPSHPHDVTVEVVRHPQELHLPLGVLLDRNVDMKGTPGYVVHDRDQFWSL